MALMRPQNLSLLPPPNGSNSLVVPSQATNMDSGIGGCAPCSGVPAYNSQLIPNCDFIPMNPPNQEPTTTIPAQKLQLRLPSNENQNTIPPPTAGELANRIQPSQRGGGKPDIRRNPLVNQRPTINPQKTTWYRSITDNPCPPKIDIPKGIPTTTKKVPRVTNPSSNGTNPCNTKCGPSTNQGEQWNNRGSQILPMQTMLYPISMPEPKLNIAPGNSDQPILQSGLKRSSVIPDDICVTYPTRGLQRTVQPIPPVDSGQPQFQVGSNGW